MIDVYDFGGQKVRIVLQDGEPWFVAVDACRAIGLGNSSDAIGRLDPDGVGTAEVIDSMGRTQLAKVVNEAGLYELIFQSRVPKAAAFRKWVTSEVLPTIRKTGRYGADLDFEDSTAMLAKALEVQSRKALALEAEVEAARPKVEVYDRIIDTGDTVGFREACKLIHAGTGAKEPEVREFMIRARWVQRLGGRLAPASYGQQNGYVTIREKELKHVLNMDGDPMVVPELRITQRGVTRAIERILGDRAA